MRPREQNGRCCHRPFSAVVVTVQSTGAGVVDTMKDLTVDKVGAIVVALMGYAPLKMGRYSFIADGVRAFLRKNPRLLGGSKKPANGRSP